MARHTVVIMLHQKQSLTCHHSFQNDQDQKVLVKITVDPGLLLPMTTHKCDCDERVDLLMNSCHQKDVLALTVGH